MLGPVPVLPSFFLVRIILKAKTKRSFKSGWCVAHRNNLQSKLLWGICRRFHCSALNQFKLRAAGWTDESTGVLLSTPGSRKSTDSASLKWNPPLAYNGFSRRCPLMSMQAGIMSCKLKTDAISILNGILLNAFRWWFDSEVLLCDSIVPEYNGQM